MGQPIGNGVEKVIIYWILCFFITLIEVSIAHQLFMKRKTIFI